MSFDWKLGVAMESSHCQNLSSPYLVVCMRVAGADDSTQTYTFEMTLSEFQSFSKTFEEIHNVMEMS